MEGANTLLLVHPQVHPTNVRYQPEEPNNQAVAVKPRSQGLTPPADHPCGPDGVAHHQPEGNLTSECVRRSKIERPTSNEMHCPCSRDIKKESRPESRNMPCLQIARKPFRPNPKRVEQKRKRNENR